MTKNKTADTPDVANFLKELKEYAVTVGEDCPEGHRRDPSSGRCLPISGLDHTEFTRSVNVDYGPEWRGEAEDHSDSTPEVALDAEEMDEPESCVEGTTFSFIQRRCITLEDADAEDAEEFARGEDESPVEVEEDAAAPGSGGHREIILMQPEGRRDTLNHECPPNQIFDYKLRECIPLNKDTIMASDLSDEFKKAVATYARLAMTAPDPTDGHKHVATLDMDGNGVTSMSGYGDRAHSHDVKKFVVQDRTMSENGSESYISRHPGVAVPEEHRIEKIEDFGADVAESAAPITTPQRKGLPDSSFGVPGKRKFPLDTCGRVRNAMARFNQAKGLTSAEKATLRRKILARAHACNIEVKNFAKATTESEFAEVLNELIQVALAERKERLESYRAGSVDQGPCPPGMLWDAAEHKCTRTSGFVQSVFEEANHSDIVKHQPDGRRDTVGFNCPDGWFFDFTNRRCLPLDPSQKPGTTTTKAGEEDAQSRVLSPNPPGKPAKLPQDCPPGTIWHKIREVCLPLDSSKKTKSEEEDAAIPPQFLKNIKKKGKEGKDSKDGKKKDDKKGGFPDFLKKKKSKSGEDDAQTTTNGPGNTGGPGCPDGQFMNPVTKKCVPRKGAFKGKSEQESAENAQPGNREGLTTEVPGRVKLPSDCPPGTAWNAVRKVCSPLSTMDKNRPSGGPGPQASTNVASDVDTMSTAQLIKELDSILRDTAEDQREKSKISAKDLPNAAFPPSLVSTAHRSLMHHRPEVTDPYDHASVDISRLRNTLFRTANIEGFSTQAVEDAKNHLLFHAREVVRGSLEKK